MKIKIVLDDIDCMLEGVEKPRRSCLVDGGVIDTARLDGFLFHGYSEPGVAFCWLDADFTLGTAVLLSLR